MYRKTEESMQPDFWDFNQTCGIALNRDDEWIRLADRIDWDAVEAEYRKHFKSGRGRPALSARIALGALIIQKKTGLSDRELIKEIARNPYYQYFIGLPGFRSECPFRHGVLPDLRKRFGIDIILRINEMILETSGPTAEHADEKRVEPDGNGNLGTLILDATCSPSDIRYPQDFSLLNEAREKLDAMIDRMHGLADEGRRPRTYRRVLRKEFLAMAKAKRRPAKKVRSLVRKMLCAVKRNLDFVDGYLGRGFAAERRESEELETIRELYLQQKKMFDTGTHRVENRIVSISKPFVRPIVRGKAKTPVEFGAKYDVSVDGKGHARLEKISFDAYNECSVLPDAVERFKERTGRYPSRVLVDRIYRTKANRDFCRERGITMSGRGPGRPPAGGSAEDAGKEKKNDRDRIEVERFFSVGKRKFGAGLIMARLSETTLGSIALSILVANLFETDFGPLFLFYLADSPDGEMSCHLIEFEEAV